MTQPQSCSEPGWNRAGAATDAKRLENEQPRIAHRALTRAELPVPRIA
jgi:hypothetical protein